MECRGASVGLANFLRDGVDAGCAAAGRVVLLFFVFVFVCTLEYVTVNKHSRCSAFWLLCFFLSTRPSYSEHASFYQTAAASIRKWKGKERWDLCVQTIYHSAPSIRRSYHPCRCAHPLLTRPLRALLQMSWFLLARSLDDMKRWMTAINLRTRHIFQREHGVYDDYRGQG